MRAFISHSSSDKDIAVAVYNALGPGAAWIDRAEIEWGEKFAKQIETAIGNVSDFVLLWSHAAAKSEWVEYELDMAVIRLLTDRAIRIKLVRLDKTPIPLRLQPFHYISTIGITDPVPTIVEALREALSQPGQGTRHRFLNRNKELERIERLINDSETQIIVLRGFLGSGKAALANESFRRFFEDPSVVDVIVSSGVGPVELALRLHHDAYREIIPETDTTEPSDSIERSMREIAGRGQFMLFRDVQHWLDDEGQTEEPLNTILRVAAKLQETVRKPVLLTSTRHIQHVPELLSNTVHVIVRGLPEEHVASLISLWHELIDGESLQHLDAARLAQSHRRRTTRRIGRHRWPRARLNSSSTGCGVAQ